MLPMGVTCARVSEYCKSLFDGPESLNEPVLGSGDDDLWNLLLNELSVFIRLPFVPRVLGVLPEGVGFVEFWTGIGVGGGALSAFREDEAGAGNEVGRPDDFSGGGTGTPTASMGDAGGALRLILGA